MGVLNVTPDSFSDGGLWLRPEAAVEHGHRLSRCLCERDDGAITNALRHELAELLERNVETAEDIDELHGESIVPGIDTPASQRFDLALGHRAALGDDADEGTIGRPELALDGCPRVGVERSERRKKRRALASLDDLGRNSEALEERVDRKTGGDDADRSGDRRRTRHDPRGGSGHVIATARGHVAHARDHGLGARELLDLEMHEIRSERASAR